MTRLLLLSVQRILKNLNEIGGEIFHFSERPLNATHQVRQKLSLLRGCRSWSHYQCDQECQRIVHIFEGTPYEQYRSMRRPRHQYGQFVLNSRIVRTNQRSPAVNIGGGIALSKCFESDTP